MCCYFYTKCQIKSPLGCLIITSVIYIHSELNQYNSSQPYCYFYPKCQTKLTGNCLTPLATAVEYSESKQTSKVNLTGIPISKRLPIIISPVRVFYVTGVLPKRLNMLRTKQQHFYLIKTYNAGSPRLGLRLYGRG